MTQFEKLKEAEKSIKQHERQISYISDRIKKLGITHADLHNDNLTINRNYFCQPEDQTLKQKVMDVLNNEITIKKKEVQLHKTAIHNIKLQFN